MVDYAALKTADAALGIADLTQAAAALNAQTVPAGYNDVSLGAIQGILLLSGDWLKIEGRAGTAPSGANPPTAADNAIPVAKLAIALVNGKAEIVHAADFQSFASLMAVLVTSGDVSTNAQTAILALGQPSPTVPKWSPPVETGQIQTARKQP